MQKAVIVKRGDSNSLKELNLYLEMGYKVANTESFRVATGGAWEVSGDILVILEC